MPKKHYLDNAEFFKALTARYQLVKSCEEKNVSPPRISEYIGKSLYDICTRLAYRPNFINYSWRQEMISDALENCLIAVDKFNHEKSTNPFGYFTQIAFFAFLRRIDMEKRQQYIKHKILEQSMIEELIELGEMDPDDSNGLTIVEYLREHSYTNTEAFAGRLEKRRQKNRDKTASLEE